MLWYIYTDKANITSETVLYIATAARSYHLVGLQKLCTEVLQKDLSKDTVLDILKHAIHFSYDDLIQIWSPKLDPFFWNHQSSRRILKWMCWHTSWIYPKSTVMRWSYSKRVSGGLKQTVSVKTVLQMIKVPSDFVCSFYAFFFFLPPSPFSSLNYVFKTILLPRMRSIHCSKLSWRKILKLKSIVPLKNHISISRNGSTRGEEISSLSDSVKYSVKYEKCTLPSLISLTELPAVKDILM